MLDLLNKITWAITTSSIIVLSLYLSLKTNFLQLNIKKIYRSIRHNDANNFDTLMLTLAGRIGVGSIAGVALSIYIGGIGSIFWLVVISILSSVLTYYETILGSIYKEKDGRFYKGGPSYYIKNGLNKNKLGKLYAIIIIISYVGGFLSIQTNTITKQVNEIVKINPYLVGLVICIVTAFIIFGGLKRITQTTAKLVPIMSLIYLLITIYILISNIYRIPNIFINIVKGAFNFKAFKTGFLTSFIVGTQRAIFSTEAGLGTGSIASSTKSIDPVKQGYTQVFGVYITSLVICMSTALIILTSNYQTKSFIDFNGIELINYSFNFHIGNIGNIIVLICIILFSFSTILTGYYYGESSLKYLTKKIPIIFLKITTITVLFLGCITSSNLLWNIVDFLVSILALINIYSIFKLKNKVYY